MTSIEALNKLFVHVKNKLLPAVACISFCLGMITGRDLEMKWFAALGIAAGLTAMVLCIVGVKELNEIQKGLKK